MAEFLNWVAARSRPHLSASQITYETMERINDYQPFDAAYEQVKTDIISNIAERYFPCADFLPTLCAMAAIAFDDGSARAFTSCSREIAEKHGRITITSSVKLADVREEVRRSVYERITNDPRLSHLDATAVELFATDAGNMYGSDEFIKAVKRLRE